MSETSTPPVRPTPQGAQIQESGGGGAGQIEFDQIQGNSFGGFNKDHQVNIFLEIVDVAKAKKTLRPLKPSGDPVDGSVFNHVHNSSSANVLRFNEQFRAVRRARMPEGSILATWTNLVFTGEGLRKLNVPELGKLPAAFTGGTDAQGAFQGMAGRASEIGDVAQHAPEHWNNDMDVSIAWPNVHALILLASDDPKQLERLDPASRLSKYLVQLQDTATSGLRILGMIRGETRVDEVGHEHFGFKDGVSQPGIRGVDAPDDPLHNPDQGNPGQDLLHPGEFVIGYPTQIPAHKPGVDGPNPDPGPSSQAGLPDWAKNGSFLVFRRLAQDVKAFRDSIVKIAGELGVTADLLGAKLVGRYRSGAPLEALSFQAGNGEYQPPLVDPGVANPALANSNALNNAFEYGKDVDGTIVPLAAHIRKAYPRDEVPTGVNPDDAESMTQTHRLLRRGIPFGTSLGAPIGGGSTDPRGLLFFAYQSDIERQFEFVQSAWVNNADFPVRGAGQDPIIANSQQAGSVKGCPFHKLADASKCPVNFQHFVKTRGGGYFFSPSIKTLEMWLT